MKKIIAYIGTWTFYYLGDFISKLIEFEIFNFLWSTYQKFMLWSLKIQEWGGLKGPWKESENEPSEEFEI